MKVWKPRGRETDLEGVSTRLRGRGTGPEHLEDQEEVKQDVEMRRPKDDAQTLNV